MRFFHLMLAALLFLAAVAPANALTQEEILKRRLDKMRQAEPEIRTEEQQRQEQNRQNAASVASEPVKADTETLAIPDSYNFV